MAETATGQTDAPNTEAKDNDDGGYRIVVPPPPPKKTPWGIISVVIVVLALLATEVSGVTGLTSYVLSFEAMGSADPTIACRNPKNSNTPFCVERRSRERDQWQRTSRHEANSENAFSLQ